MSASIHNTMGGVEGGELFPHLVRHPREAQMPPLVYPQRPPPLRKKEFSENSGAPRGGRDLVIEPPSAGCSSEFSDQETFESHCEKKSNSYRTPSSPALPLKSLLSSLCPPFPLSIESQEGSWKSPETSAAFSLQSLSDHSLPRITSHHRQDEDRRERREGEGGMNCTCLTVRNHLLILLLLLLILFNNL
jgi:hypothetical protein